MADGERGARCVLLPLRGVKKLRYDSSRLFVDLSILCYDGDGTDGTVAVVFSLFPATHHAQLREIALASFHCHASCRGALFVADISRLSCRER